MKKRCANCMYLETPPMSEPCTSCKRFYTHEGLGFYTDKFQPCTRLYLREQLETANKRITELEDAWLQDETIDVDGKLRPSVSALRNDLTTTRRQLHEAEEREAVANAEMESLHNELAAKQAIIDEQNRELAELRDWKKLYWWAAVPRYIR